MDLQRPHHGTATLVRRPSTTSGQAVTDSNATLFGPTAESLVLFGTPLASHAAGVWAELYGTNEPPAEWTKAVALAFPTMPEANLVGQMTLFA